MTRLLRSTCSTMVSTRSWTWQCSTSRRLAQLPPSTTLASSNYRMEALQTIYLYHCRVLSADDTLTGNWKGCLRRPQYSFNSSALIYPSLPSSLQLRQPLEMLSVTPLWHCFVHAHDLSTGPCFRLLWHQVSAAFVNVSGLQF